MPSGDEIKRLREGAGLSLNDLATQTGLFVNHLHAVESGRDVASAYAIQAIADCLRRRGVTETDLANLSQPTPSPAAKSDSARRAVAEPSWLEYVVTPVGVMIVIVVASDRGLDGIGWILTLVGGGYGWWSGTRILLTLLWPAGYTWRCSGCQTIVEPRASACPHCMRQLRM